MRLLVIATMFATTVLPVMAQGNGKGCGTHGNSPENPTIILGLVGGSIMAWRYSRARLAK